RRGAQADRAGLHARESPRRPPRSEGRTRARRHAVGGRRPAHSARALRRAHGRNGGDSVAAVRAEGAAVDLILPHAGGRLNVAIAGVGEPTMNLPPLTPPPRPVSMDDFPPLRRIHFRLWQISLSGATVLITAWCYTLGPFAAIVATVIAK